MSNLLVDTCLRASLREGGQLCSLPKLFALLVAEQVEGYPALRAHQEPAWHMFLVQLGAIAMHRAGLIELPMDEIAWRDIIRALTKDAFPDDEPWRLVVEDTSKPAFLQPPVPTEVELKDPVYTPDALDMLITTRNHDLKQSVATAAMVDDWIFALVSLQTSEGYGGRNNYGIVRMNGGSSSRVMMGLAPMIGEAGRDTLRPGARLRRDIEQLLTRRSDMLERFAIGYPETGGIALTWTEAWPNDRQLALGDLDIWFIEVCRRVRLRRIDTKYYALTGISASERINGKHLNGVVGDPWAPINSVESKSLTIGDEGEFNHRRLSEMLFSGDWELPLLATLDRFEAVTVANWSLVIKAIARGNSKTGGFKERIVPIAGRVALGMKAKRKELYELAKAQIAEIAAVDNILRNALALAAAGGDREDVGEAAYASTRPLRARLDTVADRLFFPALWARFEAEQAGDRAALTAAEDTFVLQLIDAARQLFGEGLADMPCRAILRPRAEARARRRFDGALRNPKSPFSRLFATQPSQEDDVHA